MHEVEVDPQDASLAYLSYYAGGLIAVQIQCPAGTPYDPANPPADTSTCELVEVGSYLDPAGNNFWGVGGGGPGGRLRSSYPESPEDRATTIAMGLRGGIGSRRKEPQTPAGVWGPLVT